MWHCDKVIILDEFPARPAFQEVPFYLFQQLPEPVDKRTLIIRIGAIQYLLTGQQDARQGVYSAAPIDEIEEYLKAIVNWARFLKQEDWTLVQFQTRYHLAACGRITIGEWTNAAQIPAFDLWQRQDVQAATAAIFRPRVFREQNHPFDNIPQYIRPWFDFNIPQESQAMPNSELQHQEEMRYIILKLKCRSNKQFFTDWPLPCKRIHWCLETEPAFMTSSSSNSRSRKTHRLPSRRTRREIPGCSNN